MKNKPIFFSVIMSVFNYEKHLSESISSIINQTFKNIEFIIVDDASTDGTKKIIEKFSKKDKRIKGFFNKNNKGLTKNLNFGLTKTLGTWIVRQDSDDISTKDRLQKAYNLIKEKEFDFYSTPVKLIGIEGSKIIPKYMTRNFFNVKFLDFKNCLIHGTLIIKNSIIQEIKYDESYKYSQDFKLYHDLLNRDYKIYYDKHSFTYLLRIHENQTSVIKKHEQFEYFNSILVSNGLKKQNLKFWNKIINQIFELKIIINDFIRRSLRS